MSARQLSKEARLSPSYVSKVERGEVEPSLRAFARMASVLGMSDREIVYLVMGENESVSSEEDNQ